MDRGRGFRGGRGGERGGRGGDRGGRGGRGRGGRGGFGGRPGGKAQTVVEPHRHKGVFIAKGKEDMLATLNMVPGESVYGEPKVAVEKKNSLTELRLPKK